MSKKKMGCVEKLYYSPKADRLFSEARELFPKYWHDGDHTIDATDYVVDGLAPTNMSEHARNELWEMVNAGLT
jgi:hypothetical protein